MTARRRRIVCLSAALSFAAVIVLAVTLELTDLTADFLYLSFEFGDFLFEALVRLFLHFLDTRELATLASA